MNVSNAICMIDCVRQSALTLFTNLPYSMQYIVTEESCSSIRGFETWGSYT